MWETTNRPAFHPRKHCYYVEVIMLATIRRLGNSQGILIHKSLLQQIGLVDEAEMRVEGDALVLRRPKAAPRTGWAEASRKLAAAGDDALVLPEFANEADAELTW
jgi:antitoxin MazE